MANIDVPYERKWTDSDLSDIVDRGDAGDSVLGQLGEKYQNLPDHERATLQAKLQALKTKISAYQGLIEEIKVVLTEMDALASEVDALNKGLLPLLRGSLKGKAEEALIRRITGAATQGSHAATTPATP